MSLPILQEFVETAVVELTYDYALSKAFKKYLYEQFELIYDLGFDDGYQEAEADIEYNEYLKREDGLL